MKFIASYPFEESTESLMTRLQWEVMLAENNATFNPDLFDFGIKALASLGTKHDEFAIQNLMFRMDRLFHRNMKYALELRPSIEHTLQSISERTTPLPSAIDLFLKQHSTAGTQLVVSTTKTNEISSAEPSSESSFEHLTRIRSYLSDNIIGQPEVIEGLMSLELRNAVYGAKRETPEVLVFMGLPGTGKDTVTQSYVNAIYGSDAAYLDHLFHLPVMKSEQEYSQVSGSATGYKGSDALPPFLEFLVRHSGGRYALQERGGEHYVIENSNWKPGMVFDGYYPPEQAVVFANEFHNWTKIYKDQFLKQFIETGLFQIRNPNGGLNKIYIPLTIIIGTNDGIDLLTSREANGMRFGKPLNYEQILEKWNRTYDDKDRLKESLKASDPSSARGHLSTATSEELLSRIPKRNIFLMRPLSESDLQVVAEKNLIKIQSRLKDAKGMLGSVEMSWDSSLPKFIQSYHYNAEENARPIVDNVISLIETPLFDAIAQSKLMPDPDGHLKIHLEIEKLADNSARLLISDASGRQVQVPISITLHDRHVTEIEDEKLHELAKLSDKLKGRIFGMNELLEKVSRAILVSEEGRAAAINGFSNNEPARSFMFLGLSSTGKTETAKALAESLYGSQQEMVTVDFSQVRSMDALKQKILGHHDIEGRAIPSDFMKEFDRRQGRVLFVFDEIANAPLDILKGLYDILREGSVSTFSDGKSRAMSGVTIIMTGNAGEEIYKAIPKTIPLNELMVAMRQVYGQFIKNSAAQRMILEKYFSEALINRIGLRNIFFFPPLSFQAIRELIQAKLVKAFHELEPVPGRRGWHIQFAHRGVYLALLDEIEREGFRVEEQGASLDKYIREEIRDGLRYELLKSVENNSKVTIMDVTTKENSLQIHLAYSQNNRAQSITLEIDRKKQEKPLVDGKNEKLLTAYHEAGHEVARQVYFSDKYLPERVTILPGVTEIGGQWIRYLGLSQSKGKESIVWTREAVIREIAVLSAGGVAEHLVTQNEINSAGVSNDIERATKLARTAILNWGLSKDWGWASVKEYSELSEANKVIVDREVQKLLNEGMRLARQALTANFKNTFLPLGVLLAEKGDLKKDDLVDFYTKNPVLEETQSGFKSRAFFTNLVVRFNDFMRIKKKTRDQQLKPSIPKPKSIAKIDQIVEEERMKEIRNVPLSKAMETRLEKNKVPPIQAIVLTCRPLLK